MKFLITLGLLSFSCIGLAADSISKSDVIDAIKESISKKDLVCSVEGKFHSRSSTINFDYLIKTNFKMTINESEQPAVKFEHAEQEVSYLTEVFTNQELTVVEELRFSTFNVKKIKVNVGTITNPKFEPAISKKLTSLLICK